ncbi:glycine betaine/proline transport system ATP-binding protein [Melghirimyces profundicolus]|uniref:Quaternary amine transport ATP-binding protein n=1 Tax=Melghirimyces profundicolus TaxID=1242148 RepID=A0A2T6BZ34_9BACL|nr:glycine betaine/L-proline ABC transporter ATP-binding protein [Melghirimyces profundicolus]PTX61334.1 glycine betaine/proline transport system ATP-binding protein [Melghirimyces profundicolus]
MSGIIKIENVTKIFGPHPTSVLEKIQAGASKSDILNETGHTVGVYDVSFEVNRGEIFVIMGLSGSGKSTLIRCLNLLNQPTEGRILIDGEDIVRYSGKELQRFRQNKVAMVFQHFGILTHRTVEENVVYGLEVKGIPKEERKQTARETLATVGLEGWEEKMPGELSGGMLQRVGLARALANDPDILLMDEPFSALDPLIRREMQQELLDIQSKLKKTIVFITHDINEAFKLGDRVAVMKDGQVIQTGTPDEILNEPADPYIEDFVKDIDRSKVLKAVQVMSKSLAAVSLSEGVQAAVKEMESRKLTNMFVVDDDQKLQGVVTIDDAIRAREENKDLPEIVHQDYFTAKPEEILQELIPKAAESPFPVAVTDETEKLLGVVRQTSILAGLT